MKSIKTILSVWMLIAFSSLVGCGPSSVRTNSLGGGYEEVVYTYTHISEPESHTIKLQFRSSDNRVVLIWPSIVSATVVTNDVALFVAAKTTEPTKHDGIWPTNPRLFAICVPGQPLDITDEVVKRWTQDSGKDVSKYMEGSEPIEPQEKDGKINIEFQFQNFPEAIISLSWNQLTNIMDVVRTSGVQHTDPKWNLNYIEKEHKTEVQK